MSTLTRPSFIPSPRPQNRPRGRAYYTTRNVARWAILIALALLLLALVNMAMELAGVILAGFIEPAPMPLNVQLPTL